MDYTYRPSRPPQPSGRSTIDAAAAAASQLNQRGRAPAKISRKFFLAPFYGPFAAAAAFAATTRMIVYSFDAASQLLRRMSSLRLF